MRPAVVLTSTADVEAGGPLRIIAVSTVVPEPLPPDYVLLPWDPTGRARTGLRRRCAAVCSWPASVGAGDIQGFIGIVPGKVLMEIMEKVNALREKP